MANSEADTSVRDVWRYCSVCKRNHSQGRKHIFTKKHLSNLKILMGKFLKKARSARSCLSRPSVHAGELEPGATVWCHCCGVEVPKHITDGNTSVEWGGLIEHMTKPEHHRCARHYWWEVGAESRTLQMVLLFPGEYCQFKEGVATALEELESQNEERIKKLADDLRAAEQRQAATALEPPVTSPHSKPRSSKNQPVVTRHPSGLASVTKKSVGGRGNVHTGATPPWLRDDDELEQESVIIGPSEEEFIKHRERLKNAGKNPKRVGADFHLKLALQRHRGEKEDENWLPSFGRVWNAGPRSQTRSEFHGEMTRENKKPRLEQPSSSGTVESPSSSSRVPPIGSNIQMSSTSVTLHALTPSQSTSHTLTPSQSTSHNDTAQGENSIGFDPLALKNNLPVTVSPYVTKRTVMPHEKATEPKDIDTMNGSSDDTSVVIVKPYIRKRKLHRTISSDQIS